MSPAPPTPQPTQAPRPAPGPDAAHGRAVLIVDDETTLARNVALYLQRLGWTTQLAGSSEEALALYAEFRPDVVLLDHNLPGRSGLDTLAPLQALDPQACVVLMTGYGSLELAVTAMRQGAADYLAKPLALGELKLRLERLTAQHRLVRAVDYYQRRQADDSGLAKLLGNSTAMGALRERISRVIEAEGQLREGEPPTVLIQGETGTGKELVARALHYDGPRAQRPFVELNCGALPPHLVEAELFGYEKGAFTDARERKIGLVETAEGGTLFLDEIGEADASTQVKLLKLLEDRRWRRLGGLREQRSDVRIIAATHRPLEQMVREGRFRADLYFRLRIVEVAVPPLRERGADAAQLAAHFLAWHAQRYRRAVPVLMPEAAERLARHDWPGNVRELRNAMEQAVLMARGAPIGLRELAFLGPESGTATASAIDATATVTASTDDEDLNLERVERRLIQTAMARTGDNITQAARLLGVSRDTLRYRLERLQLRPEGA